MDRVQQSQGYRSTTRSQFPFYHSIYSIPGVSGAPLIALGRIKADLTFEAPSGFEPGSPGLGIPRLKH